MESKYRELLFLIETSLYNWEFVKYHVGRDSCRVYFEKNIQDFDGVQSDLIEHTVKNYNKINERLVKIIDKYKYSVNIDIFNLKADLYGVLLYVNIISHHILESNIRGPIVNELKKTINLLSQNSNREYYKYRESRIGLLKSQYKFLGYHTKPYCGDEINIIDELKNIYDSDNIIFTNNS